MMPIAAFVAAAKCQWQTDPAILWKEALRIVANRSPPTIGKPFLKETDRQFKPEVLQSLLRLKENVWAVKDGSVRTLLQLAFASILINSSNLKRAPCLGYTRKLGLTAESPFEFFLDAVRRTKTDLEGPPTRT